VRVSHLIWREARMDRTNFSPAPVNRPGCRCWPHHQLSKSAKALARRAVLQAEPTAGLESAPTDAKAFWDSFQLWEVRTGSPQRRRGREDRRDPAGGRLVWLTFRRGLRGARSHRARD
jgi:hypothetical protein